ncbi:hypothetical protein TrRE_jg10952 [Triparma retinervis]|uniref:Uncharacterized protein n=1 Tax=Triparma retinervis TaxID=2557542 RepID=A0A9W7KV70_9STRA|nr:hypothetical protein TrRE_jg10952 [Triparma retinervis]
MELPWVVVDGIEDKIRGIAVAEEKVKISDAAKGADGDNVESGEMGEMEKRVMQAQQQEYNMNNSADDYVKMDNEEEFMEENELLECFKEAKKASTEVTGMYGGHAIDETGKKNPQELIGTSWGAFKIPGSSYVDRIRALDTDDVFERLKMANYMLMNRQKLLQAKLALSKIVAPGDEIQTIEDLPGLGGECEGEGGEGEVGGEE